jgi:hypothetical protein
MAATVGKDGKFLIGTTGVVAYMDSWGISPSIDTPEITAFGNSSKAYGSALRSWTVTASGTLDRSDTDQADLMDQFEDGTLADISARFYTAAASYWSGSVRLTGQTINSQVGDKVSISWTGNGNGNLSFTSS